MPPALRVLLAVAFVHGLAWSLATAPLQGPDETAHAAYAQSIAATGDGPQRISGNFGTSTELGLAARDLNLAPIIHHGEGRPFWSRVDQVLKETRTAPRDNGDGPNSAAGNGPLYYGTVAIAYHASPFRSILGRLWAMRFVGVLMFVVAVAFSWLVAAEIFSDSLRRTIATAVVALQPKLGAMAGVINPDILLITLSIAALWLALRTAREGATTKRAIGLGLLAAAAALTQPRGFAIAPPAIFALLIGLRTSGAALSSWLRMLGLSGGLALLGVALTYLYGGAHAGTGGSALAASTGSVNPREFLSYVWQFYLPKLSVMTSHLGPYYGYRQAMVESFWGSYGSLDTELPGWIYDLLQIAQGALGIWLVVLVARRWPVIRARWREVAVMVAFVVSLMVLLHYVAYGSVRVATPGTGDPVITGRYLLTVLPVLGCTGAWLLGSLRPRLMRFAAGASVTALGLMSLSGLFLMLTRSYA